MTDSSSDDSDEDFHSVPRSSPKRAKTVALQEVSRAETRRPSQTEANVTFTKRARKAKAARQAPNKEVDLYKAKEEMFEKEEQAKADRKELEKMKKAKDEKAKKMKELEEITRNEKLARGWRRCCKK